MGLSFFFVTFDETFSKMIAAPSENAYILRKNLFSVKNSEKINEKNVKTFFEFFINLSDFYN